MKWRPMILAAVLALGLALSASPVVLAVEGEALPSAPESQEPEPTPAVSPTPEPPAVTPAPEQARLYVDNRNVYAGMERSYSQGYVPTVHQGTAVLVLPLLCEGELRGSSLRARVGLSEGGPFVTKNYERTVELADNPVDQGKRRVRGYCVTFPLELQPNRDNGSYPVTVSVSARDAAGGEVEEVFTVYVTITDGRDPNATPTPEPLIPEPTPEPVPLGPKLLIQACRAGSLEEGAQEGVINAGDRLRVEVTLLNSSQTETLENMTVTAQPPEGFALLDTTDSLYVESLGPGKTLEAAFTYRAAQELAAGQYTIALNYDFAYHKGLTAQGAGTVRVNLAQPLEMEFALLQMPGEAVVSDTVEVNVQAINLSRAKSYNVRAKLEGDGLMPAGTAFLGDVEGGVSAEKPLRVTVTALSGESLYGPTAGTITYLFEDGEGRAYETSESFTVNIRSPFSGEQPRETDEPAQWWVIMAVLVAVAVAGLGGMGVMALRRRKA